MNLFTSAAGSTRYGPSRLCECTFPCSANALPLVSGPALAVGTEDPVTPLTTPPHPLSTPLCDSLAFILLVPMTSFLVIVKSRRAAFGDALARCIFIRGRQALDTHHIV